MTANALIRALEQRDVLTEEERGILRRLPAREIDFGAGDLIVEEGSRPHISCLIVEGMAARSQVLADGGRQLVALHIAGDFVDLHSFLLKRMAHGVIALSRVKVAQVPHEQLRQITESHPHLTRLLWLATLIDAAIHREWIVSMGRRDGPQRLAHLLCELFVRLRAIGLANDYSFPLPLTQAELGDVIGFSVVHANRMVQTLRKDGLVRWQELRVEILDWERLQELADFDADYLSLHREPR
jgi:CRP-like cAMP-binding protein